MLELALKQERIKYHKLKFGVDPPPLNTSNQNDSKNNNPNQSNDNNGKFVSLAIVFLKQICLLL